MTCHVTFVTRCSNALMRLSVTRRHIPVSLWPWSLVQENNCCSLIIEKMGFTVTSSCTLIDDDDAPPKTCTRDVTRKPGSHC